MSDCAVALVLMWTLLYTNLASADATANRRTSALTESTYNELKAIDAAIRDGELDQAERLLASFFTSNDESEWILNYGHSYLGYIHFLQGRWADATDTYRKLLEQPDIQTALADDARLALATLYLRMGEFENVITIVDEMFATQVTGDSIVAQLSRSASRDDHRRANDIKGIAHLELKEYAEGRDSLLLSVESAEQDGELVSEESLASLVLAYSTLGEYRSSLVAARRLALTYPTPKNEERLMRQYRAAEMVPVLLAEGHPVNEPHGGESYLIINAARGQSTEHIESLLAAGADVNVQDATVGSALCLAIRLEYVDTARLLVESGAAVQGPVCKDGLSPLALAASKSNPALSAALNNTAE